MRERGWARALFLVVIAALAGVFLWTWFTLSWSYSDGERAGVLQKFSRKGWVCKTYEGELALYIVGGVAPEIWYFSVRDEAVVEQLNQAVGKRVRLHYTEHKFIPSSCFAETGQFVDRVSAIEGEIAGPSLSAPTPPAESPPAAPAPLRPSVPAN